MPGSPFCPFPTINLALRSLLVDLRDTEEQQRAGAGLSPGIKMLEETPQLHEM